MRTTLSVPGCSAASGAPAFIWRRQRVESAGLPTTAAVGGARWPRAAGAGGLWSASAARTRETRTGADCRRRFPVACVHWCCVLRVVCRSGVCVCVCVCVCVRARGPPRDSNRRVRQADAARLDHRRRRRPTRKRKQPLRGVIWGGGGGRSSTPLRIPSPRRRPPVPRRQLWRRWPAAGPNMHTYYTQQQIEIFLKKSRQQASGIYLRGRGVGGGWVGALGGGVRAPLSALFSLAAGLPSPRLPRALPLPPPLCTGSAC